MIPYHLLSHCAIGVCFFVFFILRWSGALAALRDRSRSGITGILPPPGFHLQSPYSVWLCTNTCAVASPPLRIPQCDLFFHRWEAFSARHKEGCIVFPCSNTLQCSAVQCSAVQCSAVRCGAGIATGDLGEKKALGVMTLNAHSRFPGEIPRCTY